MMHGMQLDDLILDDAGLVRLLKLPPDADLRYYRDRAGLPYSIFKKGNQPHYRYLTSEVLRWFADRQHKGKAEGIES